MISEAGRETHVETAARPRAEVATALWERVGLTLVLLLATALNFWQLDRIGYGNTYYAAAVKSMLQNWHAFFFNSFDSIGFVGIDKPPLGFWLQVASAKIFGFSGLSLMLPQALAGVLSVAVLYYLVRRVFGVMAGLLAALALAVMPVSVAASRNNIIDGLLVLCVLLAAGAVTRAVESGRLRWLLLCAVLVGLGFNIKMLEAYLVLPALGLVYLLGAPRRWPVRIGHLALASGVLLAVSLSWATAVDLTPAHARPYVGSSGTNSELNLALGYNGLGRLTGNVFGGNRGRAGNAAPPSQATLGGFTRGETGAPGPLRLFNAALGGQVSWLLPLAVLGLIVAGMRARWRFPLDQRAQALVLWGMWLLTQAIFFSVAGFFHTYYMVMLAPSIAALAGIGLAALWHDYRRARWRGWLLPLAILGTAAVQLYLLQPYPDWSRWLTPLILGAAVIAAALLALARLARLGARLNRPLLASALAVGVLALLSAPSAWAAETVARANGGLTPSAGPSPQRGQGGFPGFNRPRRAGDAQGFGGFGGGGGLGSGSGGFGGGGGFGGFGGGGFRGGPRGGGDGGGVDTALLRYLEANQGHTRYLVATMNAMSAAPYILATGKPVMALGGFSGSDRIVTPDDLARLVANGTVRFFLLSGVPDVNRPGGFGGFGGGGFGGGGFGGGGFGGNGDLTQWVGMHCAAVPATAWQSSSTGSGFGGFFGRGGGQLYDCAAHPSTGQTSFGGATS